MLPLPQFIGDSRRIKQIIINLVRNSIKFTKRGSISVSVNYDFLLNKLMIIVSDTGDGMDAKELAQVYDCFGKLNRTADQNSVGLGLGLKIVKKIAEQYHGTFRPAPQVRDSEVLLR